MFCVVSLIGINQDENEKIIKETGLIGPKGNERGAHFLADCFAVIERCHTDRKGNVIVSLTSTFVVTSTSSEIPIESLRIILNGRSPPS